MENKYFYRTDNSLESMICKLNFSISRLKLYLDNNTTIKGICSSTKIGDIFGLKDTICGENDLKLKRIKCGMFGRKIEKLSEAIENSGKFARCYEITKAYQECVRCYQDVVNGIDIIKEGINELAHDSVNNDTMVGQLTQILNPKSNVFLHQRISVEEVENIYSKMIKESYSVSFGMRFGWNHLPWILIVLLASVAMFCTSCKQGGDNKTVKIGLEVKGTMGNKEKSQCFSINPYICTDTPVSMDTIYSFSLMQDSIANQDSIRIIVVNNTNSIVSDFTIKEGAKKQFDEKIKSPQKIIIIPYGVFCTNTEPFDIQSIITCLASMQPLIRSIIFVLVLITILLIIRPLLEKSMDRKSKLNEKIIDDRLRVQNEWQEILQAEYRLDINRDELGLRIREKEENARIEEEKQAAAHSRTLQSREMELEFEREKLEMSQRTNNNQLEAQRLRSLNDQIMRIIISLTSNQQSNGSSNTVANQTID